MKRTYEQVEAAVKRIMHDTLGVRDPRPEDKILEDLSLGSLDMAELAIELEDEFGIEISEAELEGPGAKTGGVRDRTRTVGDVIRLVWSKVPHD